MTKEQNEIYQDPEKLRQLLKQLKDKKFQLEGGLYVTFGHPLVNNITIYCGHRFKVILLAVWVLERRLLCKGNSGNQQIKPS